MKNPWFKFYPTDWRGDQALRICSLEARGLWIEMLCIMHSADPYGHLLINGHPVTDMQIAALTGTDPITASRLIKELETAGAFSRNGKSIIYSRRMTRDYKKAKLAKENGRGGGNPTLCNTKQNKPPDNPKVNQQDKGRHKPQNPSPDPEIKNPPLPPNGKNFNGNGFDILNLISDDGLMDARSQAPGWDVQGYLVPFYNARVSSGEFERPRYPNKAFPAWCKSFTKGKRPQ